MTSVSNRTASGAGFFSPERLGSVWLFVIFATAFVVFWDGLVSLGQAWIVPEYSHGPLIPVLSAYLFLRQLRENGVPENPPTGRWIGLIVVCGGLGMGFIGDIARIPDITTYGMLVWLYGVLLVTFGFNNGWVYWPPVLHLIYMLPLPNFLYWQISIQLQFISSELGVWFIRLMNIPVFLDGNVIDLGIYKLHVAEACSGLRYLFPVMSFSYVFAVLYRGPTWIKAVLLLSAVPITVVMNSFRIGVIGVLVDSYGIEQAEGFLHYFEGWVIFILCILILFGLARGLQRLTGDRRPIAEALDLSYHQIAPQFARSLTIKHSSALAITMGLMLAAAIGWHLAPAQSNAVVERDPLALFPAELGNWQSGVPQRLDAQIEQTLGADDYHSVVFMNPNHRAPVSLFVAYYLKQTEGAGIHSPEVCIPAGGWEMSRIKKRTIPLSGGDSTAGSLTVNRAVIQKGLAKQVVYYWFEARGRQMTNDYIAKAMTLLDAVSMGRTDGALVRVITPIATDETEAHADARLTTILSQVVPELPRFVPH